MSLENLSQSEVESLASLAKGLADNPKTRLHLQALVKAAYPETSTPELDSAMAIRDLTAKMDQREEEFSSFRAQQESRDSEMREWAEVVGAGNCTYNDIPDVRKFMEENGIGNKAYGAKAWGASKALATPSSGPSRTFEMPSTLIDKWRQGGSKSLNAMTMETAREALAEFRSGKVI